VNLEQIRLQDARRRIEIMRWLLLVTLNVARPAGATPDMMLRVMRGEYPEATALEIRRELDYLHERELVKLTTDFLGNVYVKIARYGIDIVEYMVDCEPGIARPRAEV